MSKILREILHFFRTLTVYILQTQVIVVSSLSFTPFYSLYILFNIVGFFCQKKDSLVSLVCENLVVAVVISGLVLLVLLNLSATREGVERLIGHSFLERHMPGKYKPIFSLFLFLLTFSFLGYVESTSVLYRVKEFGASMDLIYQEIDKINKERPVEDVVRSVNNVILMARDLPYDDPPRTGIITDIASYFSRF